MAQNPQVTQPNNIPNNGIPTSAGPAPAGMVPTFGAAGIFTGYAAAPTQNVNVGGQSTPITKPVTTPPSPVAPQTAPVSSPAPTSSSPSAPTQQQSNTQFYYTQTKDASGKNVTTYYDGNGNVLPTNPIGGDQFKDNPQGTPNAGNNLVQLPAGSSLPSGESPDQLNGDIQTSTQNYTTELDNLNSESDKAFTQYESQLSRIENGTFPLTPAQQSLLDATKQQLDILRDQQMTANNAYLQGTETLQGRTGLTSGGTQTAMATVENAINSGIQALSALDAKGAETLATLQKGFETDDLQLINDSYDAYQKYETQKEATLKDIQSATISAAQDQRDFTYKQMQDNIANTMANDKFTYEQKQDAIANALNQAQLDEKVKTDLQDYQLKQESLNLQRQANDLLSGAFQGGTPQTLANGQIDPNAQANFLAKLPPTAQTLVKGLDDYTINPSSLPTRLTSGGSGLTQQQALALVKAYDPNYDESQYAARAKYNLNFNSGAINTQRVNINTALNHLNDLKTAADALGPLFTHGGILGIGTQTYNNIAEVLANNAGDPRVTAYNNIANKVSTEIAGAYGEGTGGERTSQEVLSQINSSAAQKDALINSTVTLLSGLTNSMYSNYQSNMGKAPKDGSIIFPNTQQVISNLQSKGIGTDVNFVPSQFAGVSNDEFLNSGLGVTEQTQSSDPQTFFQLFNNTQNAAVTTQQ